MKQLIGFDSESHRLISRIAKSLEKLVELKQKELDLKKTEISYMVKER